MTINEMVKIWEGMTPEQRQTTAVMSMAMAAHIESGVGIIEILKICESREFSAGTKSDWDAIEWPFKFGQAAEHPTPEAMQ